MPAESPLRDGDGAGFELIETLRWEGAGGFMRLDRHLSRLHASARALGFECESGAAGRAVGKTVPDVDDPWPDYQRIRLTLAANGKVRATAHPFALQPPSTIWTARLARTRLDSSDALLRHKTSRRGLYDAARAEFTHDQADEVILLNERGEVCEGCITNLFVDSGDGGPLLTPALDCGLLAGVLRAELLEKSEARQAVLTAADLRRAKALFVGNSLRGLIRCELTG